MSKRRIFSLILNLAAVLGPTAALYARYGADTTVRPEDASELIPIVGAMVVSFIVGLISARTLHSTAEGFASVFQSLMQALHQASTNMRSRTAG